jgi:hypothetical protein
VAKPLEKAEEDVVELRRLLQKGKIGRPPGITTNS